MLQDKINQLTIKNAFDVGIFIMAAILNMLVQKGLTRLDSFYMNGVSKRDI